MKPFRAGVAAALLLSVVLVPAESRSLLIGALKGPSGIGMVRLFEEAPSSPDGGSALATAVASADLMVAKLVSGEFDAAVLPVNMAAKLYNAGIPLVLGAIVGEGMISFLSSDPAIKSLADLKGRAVQVSGQGATPDYLFRKLLRTAGLDPDKDLKLSYALPYPEAATALAAGKIPCALLPEPFATLALSVNPGLASPIDIASLWSTATGQRSYPMTAFVLSTRLAGGRPDLSEAILSAYEASIAWVTANPKEAGALVEKHELGLKAQIAAKAIPRSAYVFTRAADARPAIEALLTVFLDTSPASVGGKLPGDGFYAKSR